MLLTVRRAGELLDLFRGQGEWGVTAIAVELGVTKSQAHELLNSLCFIGLVRRVSRGRYRLGWGAVSLYDRLLHHEFRGRLSRPVRRLAAATGQTVLLVALDRSRAVVLATARGADARATPDSAHDATPQFTAAGKLLLATTSVDEPATMGLSEMPPVGSRHSDPDCLRSELADIARRQLAFDLGECDSNRRAVAAPVHSPDGAVFAALSVSTDPEHWRLRKREYTILVQREAQLLSRELRDDSGLSSRSLSVRRVA